MQVWPNSSWAIIVYFWLCFLVRTLRLRSDLSRLCCLIRDMRHCLCSSFFVTFPWYSLNICTDPSAQSLTTLNSGWHVKTGKDLMVRKIWPFKSFESLDDLIGWGKKNENFQISIKTYCFIKISFYCLFAVADRTLLHWQTFRCLKWEAECLTCLAWLHNHLNSKSGGEICQLSFAPTMYWNKKWGKGGYLYINYIWSYEYQDITTHGLMAL